MASLFDRGSLFGASKVCGKAEAEVMDVHTMASVQSIALSKRFSGCVGEILFLQENCGHGVPPWL
jgi:hypothetical protein